MKQISLVHPFSAKAIGLSDSDVYHFHSQPHIIALKSLKAHGYRISVEYFTGCLLPFVKTIDGIEKKFWPISHPIFKDRHKWRKQKSIVQSVNFKINPPDLTVFNMSGHGSRHTFELANTLRKKNRPYIAMIGGLHMSSDSAALNYYRHAHHLIVHTEKQKSELLLDDKFSNLDIKVIPLGINTDLFKPNFMLKQPLSLLFVGRITPLKQIELAITALKESAKVLGAAVTLDIVGPIGNVEYYYKLQKMIRDYGLQTQVNFRGSMVQKDLVPLYQRASLLLVPSKHESFGMVMVESMACGTPVAAIKGSGGPDELISNGKNGILTSINSFENDVLNLLQSNYLSALQRKCQEEVGERWNSNLTNDAFRSSVQAAFN